MTSIRSQSRLHHRRLLRGHETRSHKLIASHKGQLGISTGNCKQRYKAVCGYLANFSEDRGGVFVIVVESSEKQTGYSFWANQKPALHLRSGTSNDVYSPWLGYFPQFSTPVNVQIVLKTIERNFVAVTTKTKTKKPHQSKQNQ